METLGAFLGGIIGSILGLTLFVKYKPKQIEIHKIKEKKGRKQKIVWHSDEDLYKKELEEKQ